MAKIKMRSSCPLVALLACVLASLFASCSDNDVLYDEFVSLRQHNWSKDSLAIFQVDVSDTVSSYDVALQVRNDNSYPFANLWLFIDVVSPDGLVRRDTTNCQLAEPDGAWLGAGWGSLYTVSCPYLSNVRFSKPGVYSFRLSQGMRTDSLEGLHNIGLIISKNLDSSDGKE